MPWIDLLDKTSNDEIKRINIGWFFQGRIIMKRIAIITPLLPALLLTACLWDPLDGQINATTSQTQTFSLYWTASSQPMQLECSTANGWQYMANGLTATSVAVNG